MLRDTFLNTLAAWGMDTLLAERGTVIVGFSGGADSSVLVHLLAEYTSERGIRMILAHVNHGIRGAEADADEQFAIDRARELGLTIRVTRADVPAIAHEKGVGLEEAARDVRYAFFETLAEEYNAVTATAHNGDDNLETILFRMMRGTGLRGLSGIDPVREDRFIRPLIALSSNEIRAFAEAEGIPYRMDSTNHDTAYTRNYIRHEILPKLKAVSDAPHKAAYRMAALLRSDEDFIMGEAERACPHGRTSIKRERLTSLHPAVASRVLRNMAASFGGAVPTEAQTDAMLALAASEKSEGSIRLTQSAAFHVTRHEAEIRTPPEPGGEPELYLPMDIKGSEFENERYRILVSPKEHDISTEEYENIYKLSIHKILCSDKIIGSLYMKYRNQGDTYTVGGMTKKIGRMMIDRKLTADEKRLLPLLCDDDGILWMPFGGLRDGMAGAEGEKNTVHLYFFIKK